jgi:hypothetical protein
VAVKIKLKMLLLKKLIRLTRKWTREGNSRSFEPKIKLN